MKNEKKKKKNKPAPSSGWKQRLEKVKERLGDVYAALDRDLKDARGKKAWTGKGFKEDLPSKHGEGLWVQLGDGIPETLMEPKGPAIGIFVEPLALDDEGAATTDELRLELAVYMKLPGKVKDYHAHDALMAWLEEQVTVAFPDLAGKQLSTKYPNSSPKPAGHPFIYGWDHGSSAIDSATVLWLGLVAPTGATIATSNSDAWLEQASRELAAELSLFSNFVHFIRGAVAPRRSTSLPFEAFLGWCGEYVMHVREPNWTWNDSTRPEGINDFSHEGESHEVKSSLGVPPSCPYFSVDQIRQAIREGPHYHVITIGLDRSNFEFLFARAKEVVTAKPEGFEGAFPVADVWPHRLATNVGIPFMVAARDLATDKAFLRLLAKLVEVKFVKVERIEPNPFCTPRFEPLRQCVNRKLVCGRIQVNLSEAP
jgi:hypothetical protein